MYSLKSPISIDHQIGQGSFSTVFKVQNSSENISMALKIENIKINYLEYLQESTIYNESIILKSLQGIKGIPKLYWFGLTNQHSCLLTQLLGKDLKNYISIYNKLSLSTIIKLAISIIDILKSIHEKHIIHRDIKPDNIMFGNNKDDSNTIYLIDFNLAKFFEDSHGHHTKKNKCNEFDGNLQFSSINSHFFMENSRKDDLESLGYLLLFCFQGELPWKDFDCSDIIKKINKIGMLKKSFISNITTSNSFNICECFVNYFKYVSNLKYETKPDYDYLKSIFTNFGKEFNFSNDDFEWEREKESFVCKENKLFQKKFSEDFNTLLEVKLGVKSFKRSKSHAIEDQIND